MMRRFIDVLFVLLSLIITAPAIVLIAILIKLDSPGSVLYTPQMVGQNGKRFSLFRFRTMPADVPQFSSEQRLTRVGKFIRNYSLDHLPMLINLLKGDLTIIGPRPIEVQVVDLQDPTWQQYFRVKPGLFNYAVLKLGYLWNSSRVNDLGLNQELELEYRQKQSTASDWRLFIRFLRAFITSRGNVKARGKPDLKVTSGEASKKIREECPNRESSSPN